MVQNNNMKQKEQRKLNNGNQNLINWMLYYKVIIMLVLGK